MVVNILNILSLCFEQNINVLCFSRRCHTVTFTLLWSSFGFCWGVFFFSSYCFNAAVLFVCDNLHTFFFFLTEYYF